MPMCSTCNFCGIIM